MIYNLKNPKDLNKFEFKVESLKDRKGRVDLTEPRSIKQNSALHKFFDLICQELNELGMEFKYFGVRGTEISTRYTTKHCKGILLETYSNSFIRYKKY